MMTEEEAKTKWCCMGHAHESGQQRCIASACMAWRRVETQEFKSRAQAEFRKSGRRLESDEGYCGMAGRPE